MKTSAVIKFFGSVRQTAEFFGVRRQAVYEWLYAERDRNKPLPKERQYELSLRLPEKFPYRGR